MFVHLQTTSANTLTDEPRARATHATGEPREDPETIGCRELICAVIEEQVKLVLLVPNFSTSTRDMLEARQARGWFRGWWFEHYCACVGLDPEYVRAGVSRRLVAMGRAPL